MGHLFSHYINVTYEEFLARIVDFASNNTKWIEKVGVHCLRRLKLTVMDFVKGLHNATILFDELCIMLACQAFNVHCVVLLDGSYWSTRPNNDFTDCLLKIAYIGDFGFKELCTESALIFSEHESKDSDTFSEIDDDLKDTGLYGSDNDSDNADDDDSSVSEEQMDVKPLIRLPCSFSTHAEDPIVLSDDEPVDTEPTDQNEPVDVKPFIKLPCSFSTHADDPIVLSNDEPVEQVDVKPFILDKILFTASYEDPIVLSDTEATDQNEPAVNKLQPTSGSTVISAANTTPNKPRFHRIKPDRNYSCYICDEQFKMQGSFITHHNEQHPDSCFKCEFCDAYYKTCNGLFKHQCSHLYMKYKCKDCDKFFQFPYQFRNHLTQHTGVGKHLCSICAKSFRSKCSKDFHEKTHNVKIKCDLCPMSTSKVFNSTVALHIHQRRMHGQGWTSLCGKNYK